MAKTPNYGFEKRRKEQERKAKKDAKRAERQQRNEAARRAPEVEEGADPETAPTDADEAI